MADQESNRKKWAILGSNPVDNVRIDSYSNLKVASDPIVVADPVKNVSIGSNYWGVVRLVQLSV